MIKIIENDYSSYSAEIFCIIPGDQRVIFNLKSSSMSWLALSDSFEYQCYMYGSTANGNMFTLTVRGSTLVVRI